MLKQIEKIRERFKKHSRLSKDFSEASTRTSFVSPFIRALGYDTADPDSVCVEYNTNPYDSQGGKVDYALLYKGDPKIFVEAKKLHEDLEKIKYKGQINQYFSLVEQVDFVILTNGNQYRLFTDLKKPNILDNEPFIEFNLNEIDEKLVEYLTLLSPQSFNSEKAKHLAAQWARTEQVYTYLKQQFDTPSEKFVSFLSKLIFGSSKLEIKKDVKKALGGIDLSLVDFESEDLTVTDHIKPPIDNGVDPDPSEEKNPFAIEFAKRQKIEYFRFQNEKIIGNISDMYVHVIKHLYETDRHKLIEISKTIKSLKITSSLGSIRKPMKISDGVYVGTNLSTSDKIRLLKKGLTEFNMEDSLRVKLQD